MSQAREEEMAAQRRVRRSPADVAWLSKYDTYVRYRRGTEAARRVIDQSEDEGVAARLGAKIAHAEKRMPELRRELIDAPAQTGGVSGSAVKSGLIADGDAEQKMKDAVQLLKVAKQEMKEAIQLFKEAKQEMKEAEWKMMDLEAIRARERGRQPTMEDFPPTVQGPFNALYADGADAGYDRDSIADPARYGRHQTRRNCAPQPEPGISGVLPPPKADEATETVSR
ncbi:hypothetical protein BU26DRAFT_593142 [Trematosphaeria pertusa]|uniref:Uncharacterized protein n=1 Tax=Trematosphaeria pertusa TaxID=390896 RepID=A0A6A6IIB4_9PLEO|nr:uncharacterized protein BU26DRAFT_593142 [Trematosphaeria pertusa]KAF2249788.1 hypothetical protein BU26DRAFT_593142 [Trematosphaeria pertusa]